MKILIVGGTGFISGRLTEVLLERGHDVTIFTRGRTEGTFARPLTRLRAIGAAPTLFATRWRAGGSTRCAT